MLLLCCGSMLSEQQRTRFREAKTKRHGFLRTLKGAGYRSLRLRSSSDTQQYPLTICQLGNANTGMPAPPDTPCPVILRSLVFVSPPCAHVVFLLPCLALPCLSVVRFLSCVWRRFFGGGHNCLARAHQWCMRVYVHRCKRGRTRNKQDLQLSRGLYLGNSYYSCSSLLRLFIFSCLRGGVVLRRHGTTRRQLVCVRVACPALQQKLPRLVPECRYM